MNNFIPDNIKKSIVLVGMMGAGKTSLGARLAYRLKLPFIDIDQEIQNHLGYNLSYIFEYQGEGYFRKLEYEFVDKALKQSISVISVGGGAFINDQTREIIKTNATTIWLKTELDILYNRVKKRKTRPILEKGDKREILEDLVTKRYPIYEQADIVVTSNDEAFYVTINSIIDALDKYYKQE